jgi:hypothetical protein
MSHSNGVIPTPLHPPQKKPSIFPETPQRGGLLKVISNRQILMESAKNTAFD